MDRWVGKIALVTGAGSGIGAATAEELAKNGVKVFGVDILEDKLKEMEGKLKNSKGGFTPVKCDLSKEDEILKVFNFIKEKAGTIHILVYAAGIARLGLISEMKIEHCKQIFDVNVIGLIIATQQALKLMKETNVEDGHILWVNSIGGHGIPNLGAPRYNVYNASKYAVTALTESLRQELVYLKSKIRISTVSPGSVATNFREHTALGSGIKPDADDQTTFKGSPRLDPKDIADAIIYEISTPSHVQIHDIIIKPVGEKY